MSYEKHLNGDIRTGRHCVFNMHVHLVFVTKYRRKVLNEEHIATLKSIFEGVCERFEAILEECNGEEDHIHLLINYPPKVAVSRLVNSLKTVSSRMLRQKYAEIQNAYFKNMLWTPSYFSSSCGGAPLSIIKEYVQSQRVVNKRVPYIPALTNGVVRHDG